MLPFQPERRAGCPVVALRLHKIENAGLRGCRLRRAVKAARVF